MKGLERKRRRKKFSFNKTTSGRLLIEDIVLLVFKFVDHDFRKIVRIRNCLGDFQGQRVNIFGRERKS